jgi:mono/diheme cytochrome c family protein
VKVGLMAVMVALGAFNMLVVGPRLAAAGGEPAPGGRVSRRLVGLVPDGVGQLAGSSFAVLAGALRRSVRIELGLGLVVLAVAALLTGLAPAREEIARRSSTDTLGGPVDRRLDVDGVPVQVSISPAVVGENVFSIGLPSTDPSTVERAQLTLTYLDAEQGSQPLILPPAADKPDTWSSTAPLLSQPGQWQAEVLVRRTGQDDLRSSLRFLVAGPGGAAPPSSSASAGYPLLPSPLTTLSYVIMAGGLVVVATGFLRNGSRRHRTTQAAVIAAGFLVIACGGYVYAREQTEGVPLDVANVRDPVPPDQRSLASGKQIYAQYCETCHGETGRGDGPTGLRLVPRPADLQIHMAPGVHSDGELFYWISYGYPNSAMPAWHNTLSEQERWDVINYARTLVPDR